VSPNQREREYARRRYEKWQERVSVKEAARLRAKRRAVVAGSATVAVLALVGAVLYFRPGGAGSLTTAAASPSAASPSAASDVSAAATTSAPAATTPTSATAAAVANPCGRPPAAASPAATPPSWPTPPDKSLAAGKSWTWTLETSCGAIKATLEGAKAPQAVASTIFLVQHGFWNKTPCHRLTTQGIYVLQCGDPTGTGTGGPGYSYGPVENAPTDNVYPAGTVAMARQGNNGSSMGSQFFLVYKDSPIPADSAGGYTVLGRITSGLDVLTKIADGGATGGSDGPPARAVSILASSVGAG
jgi:peptidyl-prolyl cis-trans isomerase B (cyclophilin B)